MTEYKLPDEAKGDIPATDEFDEFVRGTSHPGGVERLGQSYIFPKGAGRLDESTQRSVPPFKSPYRSDDLEIEPPLTTDEERSPYDIYRGKRHYAPEPPLKRRIKLRGIHIINHCIIT